MNRMIGAAVLFALLITAQPAFASQFRIDFSGEFYTSCIDCDTYDTGALLGTSFSGQVVIPVTAVAEPGEYLLGETVYLIDSANAWFSLDAADDRFDFNGNLATTAYVRDGECIYSCADKFSLFFANDDYLFEMGFVQNAVGDPLDGEDIPTLAEFQQLLAMDTGAPGQPVGHYFTIGMPSWDGWVSNFDDSDVYSYKRMSASVAVIPLPSSLALFPVALVMLGWFGRRRAAASRTTARRISRSMNCG